MGKLYSSGEFAKMCGVKKDTVLYYDKIGLLKPEFVNEKGYRFYSWKSFLFMYWVKIMRKNDVPLEEMVKHREKAEAGDLLSLIAESRENMIKKRQDLDFRIKCSEAIIAMAEDIKNQKWGNCYVDELCEEYYIRSEFYFCEPIGLEYTFDYEMPYYNEMLSYMEKNNIEDSFLGGFLTKFSAYKNKEDCYCFLNSIFDKIDCDRLVVKPAGKYLCFIQQKEYESMFDIVDIMHDYAEKNGLKLSDDIYIWDLAEYYVVDNEDNSLFMYQIQILE